MSKSLKLFAAAAVFVGALALTPGSAQARWHHGWHHHWGPGIGFGLAFGPAWDWGGPYAYYGGPYYGAPYYGGPNCGWVRHRWHHRWRRAWRCW